MNCLNCCVSDDLVEYTCGHSFQRSMLLSRELSILNPRCSECNAGKLGCWEDSSSEKRFSSSTNSKNEDENNYFIGSLSSNEDEYDYFIGSLSSNEVSENEVNRDLDNWYSDNEDSKSEYSETDYNIYKEKCENLILLNITLFGLITIGIIVKLIIS